MESPVSNSFFDDSVMQTDLHPAWAETLRGGGRGGASPLLRRSTYLVALLVVLSGLSGLLIGCGSGGYAGGGITSLSQSTATIDAGQSVSISATIQGNLPLSWTVSGAACSGSSCGSVSTGGNQSSAVYTAPASLTSQIVVSVTATIPGTKSSKVVTITVNPALAITGNTPSGTVGTAYSGSIGTTGGTSPVTISLVAGTLPAGLTFDATTGKITGTPTAAGTATFTIRASDRSDVPTSITSIQQITISAAGTVTLSISGNPPAGVVGTAYSTTLNANGGTQPATFAVTAGSLPAGLSLSSAGVISGTPTTAGSATFTTTATDAAGSKASATFTITVTAGNNGGSLTITTGTLPNGTINVPYSATIGVTGGTGPYSCTLITGTLPAGLSLGANCAVTGTPTVTGTSPLTVRVADSSNPALTITGAVSITINAAGLSIGSGTLPNGTVGTVYTATLPVTGGTAPYTCTVTGGTLPAGLTLGTNCAVSGTPTTAGTSTPTITVKDSANPAQTITPTVSITINAAGLAIGSGTLPNGTVGTVYTATLPVTGGTAPYSCTLTSGTMPAGLTLGANCAVSGTPTTAGTSTPTITVKDSANPAQTITPTVSITINAAGLAIGSGTLPNGTVGTVYTATLPVTGGTAPYSCTVTGGTLPAGLTLGTNCAVSGTPTTAGTSTPTITVKDASNPAQTITPTVSITINAAGLSIGSGTLPNGTVGTVYTATLPVTGGTAPYTCTVTGGTLPAGLTLGTNCAVSGTPTTAGTSTPTITVKDSANPAQTITPTVSITINPATLGISSGTLPNGTVGTVYSATLPVTGGTAPYTCTVTGGTLPAGLTLGANCAVTGTPTTAGTSTPTITIKDSANPAQTITPTVSITIAASTLSIGSGTLPNGTVGTTYTAILPVTGGTAPYTCTLTSGTLPAGLTLGANCAVSGTPTTAGTSTPTITVKDASNPAQTITPTVSITIDPSTFRVTNGTLPNGTVGTPYSQLIPIVGGTSPYSCSLASGAVPPGLTINANCTVTGTPSASGTYQPTLTIKDSSNPQQTITSAISITINPVTLTLGTGALPNGTVGTVYTATLPVSGGTSPYSCTVTVGTLPAGLTLGAGCTVTGTPTTAGTSTPTILVTDSANPAATTSGPISITIVAAPSVITISSPPAATVNVPYTGTIPVTGGTGPYTCQVVTGTVPGLTINSNCSVSGTPTTAGSTPVTVKVTDASSPVNTKTGTTTITVNAPTVTLTLTAPPAATVNTPYTGTIGVTGGTAPYSCTLAGGTTLPAGLTLGGNCVISGTPTTVGTTTVSVTATDSATPSNTTIGPVVITVNAIPALTFTGSLPNAILGVAYTQTLQASGGVGPYTYAVTAGALPAGLSLSSTGTVSGTPTAPGASSFTITATDSEATPQTKALPLILLVTYPVTPDDSKLKGPYAYLFQGNDDAVLGVLAYRTATAASFTADGAGVISAGEMDSNHQTSNPSGNTIASNAFLGTYTIGTDLRGSLTLSTLAADGTVASNTTYAIALRAPVSPVTVSSAGSMVLADTNLLASSKGSGTLLLQDATKLAAGLNGSYVFGLQGDAPCFPTCTVGLAAGPAASVGQFTASNNTITGTGDANLAQFNYAQSTLAGSYSAADANGRVQLTMTTSKLTGVPFPTDYAVYVVDATHLFVISTDKHSAYVLQAGTAQLQTQATYSNASLNSAFIGYENSPVNPGLVGATLQNVASLSSATIFRATGNNNGTCTTTNVDTGGTTGLVNSIAGATGGGVPLIGGLLGTYQSLGNSTCAVASNGRAVLNYPAPSSILSTVLGLLGVQAVAPAPRIVYLVSPNNGYFLESSYAGVGMIEPQIGTPTTVATLNGKFTYNQVPASTIATIAASGNFTADGAGNAVTTLDETVGVGSLNVLTLGVTQNNTYTLTDGTAGRYNLGNYGTIYAIAPGRFVLLQTDAVGTSPYIALLY